MKRVSLSTERAIQQSASSHRRKIKVGNSKDDLFRFLKVLERWLRWSMDIVDDLTRTMLERNDVASWRCWNERCYISLRKKERAIEIMENKPDETFEKPRRRFTLSLSLPPSREREHSRGSKTIHRVILLYFLLNLKDGGKDEKQIHHESTNHYCCVVHRYNYSLEMLKWNTLFDEATTRDKFWGGRERHRASWL